MLELKKQYNSVLLKKAPYCIMQPSFYTLQTKKNKQLYSALEGALIIPLS